MTPGQCAYCGVWLCHESQLWTLIFHAHTDWPPASNHERTKPRKKAFIHQTSDSQTNHSAMVPMICQRWVLHTGIDCSRIFLPEPPAKAIANGNKCLTHMGLAWEILKSWQDPEREPAKIAGSCWTTLNLVLEAVCTSWLCTASAIMQKSGLHAWCKAWALRSREVERSLLFLPVSVS